MALLKENIIRTLNFNVTESAAATFTQQTVSTNFSLERKLVAQIHSIAFWLEATMLDTPAVSGLETAYAQITRESKTDILNFNDGDLIAKFGRSLSRSAAVGTDAGPIVWMGKAPDIFYYSPPLLYGAANIYFGLKGSATLVITAYAKLLYSLVEVPDKLFFEIAQGLV